MLDDITVIESILFHHCYPDSEIGKAWQRIKSKIVEVQKPSHNTRFTQCPKCGSVKICYWHCHDRYGCYDCDWVEAQRKA
jgi:ribosomal protein S27E